MDIDYIATCHNSKLHFIGFLPIKTKNQNKQTKKLKMKGKARRLEPILAVKIDP